MTPLTPRAQLLTDLMADVPEAAGTDFSTWGDDADLTDVTPGLTDLIYAAHLRVRGMRAATVAFPGPAGPVPAVALRSSTDMASVTDFAELWGRALDAVYGKPRSTEEALAISEVPVQARMDGAYPGVVLASPPDGRLAGEFTLYARGADAVRQLAALLRAALDGWPVPDWVGIVRREDFLLGVLDALAEGRDDGAERMIRDFER
ncbi:hypothetical protein AB0D90_03455 [Streptomyces althioticus]|uniref:hypothetical protein n=1 Tax=Streptomyces althioticus TaxID=83380 RepID=UPI0033CD9EB5